MDAFVCDLAKLGHPVTKQSRRSRILRTPLWTTNRSGVPRLVQFSSVRRHLARRLSAWAILGLMRCVVPLPKGIGLFL